MKTKPIGQTKPKQKPLEQSVGQVTRCKKCGSTRRAPYHNRKELAFAGLDAAGNSYTHVVWRRTHCLDCDQHRVDRHTENRPSAKTRRGSSGGSSARSNKKHS